MFTITTELVATDTGTQVNLYALCEPAEGWDLLGDQIRGLLKRSFDRLSAILEEQVTDDRTKIADHGLRIQR